MTSSRLDYPFRYEPPAGALRLRLSDLFGKSTIDGFWWPYSRDLTREGPHLMNDFPVERGQIDRVAIYPSDWPGAPAEVFSRFGRIKLGTLGREQAGFVLVRLTHVHQPTIVRIRLLNRALPAAIPAAV